MTPRVPVRRGARIMGVNAVALLIGAGVPASSVAARDVRCGDVIVADTQLDADVGPCPDGGLAIGADHVVLDLNGHAVFGAEGAGDGVGVVISGRTGVRVTNGTVMRFDAGVYIEGGGHNELSYLDVVDNVSSSLGRFGPGHTVSFGDGIVLNSNDNLIRRNAVRRNGPNDGIGVFANSGGNVVRGNVITENDVVSGSSEVFDDGIRLESGAHDDLVVDNIVERNGRTGIAVFAYGAGNVIRANLVRWNGPTTEGGRGTGAGIRLYAATAGTVVRGNRSFGNRADGIRVDGRSNLITGNRTGGNGAGGRGHDLHDSNRHPACDGNVWSANTFRTAIPDCTKGQPAAHPSSIERRVEPPYRSALIVRSSGLPSVRTVPRCAGSRREELWEGRAPYGGGRPH